MGQSHSLWRDVNSASRSMVEVRWWAMIAVVWRMMAVVRSWL